jgi:hypothetical protein
MNPADIPAFRGYRAPNDADAIDRARSQIATSFGMLDIPMTIASASVPGNSNGWVLFNIAGTSLYVDNNPSLGNAAALLQFNTQQDAGAAQFYAQAGQSWENLPYKQIALSWAAQSGKTMRLMYSMDGRVFPSGAGAAVSATIVNVLASAVPTTEGGVTYGVAFKSVAALVAGTPENVWSAASNVNGVLLHRFDWLSNAVIANEPLPESFLCKATAPTSHTDGVVISFPTFVALAGTKVHCSMSVRAINIPAALRGDAIVAGATNESQGYRTAFYTLK